MAQNPSDDFPIYTRPARHFHWWIALLILFQFPIGFYMTYRGYQMEAVNDKGEVVKGVWDGVTDTLYSSHKIIGITILLLVVLRLAYRIIKGAPPPEASLPPVLIGASHLTHWSIYLLLLVVPILGYVGISYFGALDAFGISFPAVTEKDEKVSEQVLGWHAAAAIALLALIAMHIAAAIFHRFIRRDRVVDRMLPRHWV